MNKYFLAFSQKLAGWLMFKGFILQGMRADKNATGRNVFIFNDSEELQNIFKEFKSLNK